MLSESFAAEQREAVTHPSGYAGDSEHRDPHAAVHKRELAHDDKRDDGVCQNAQRCKSARTAYLLGYDAGRHDGKYREKERDLECEGIGLEPELGDRSNAVDVQYPRLAYDVLVSDGAACFPNGHYHGSQKEQRPRHGTQCKAGNYQYYQHRCRNNSCFQVTDLLS